MSNSNVCNGLTSGDIARELRISPFKVMYLLRSRGIREMYRVGNLRVFPLSTIELLRGELRNQHKITQEEVETKNG